jgi:phosphopantetheinyl transferase (holo-ACP synthase)
MSTGNDIVALALTDPERTSRHRFYSRILTTSEVSLNPALPFSSFVWLLWSVKESAYKYCSRSNPQLVFAPLKVSVVALGAEEGFFQGIVSYGGVLLYSRSFETAETIMTVVSEEQDFRFTRWGMRTIGSSDYGDQSSRVRELALDSLATEFPGLRLRLDKAPDGPPVLCAGDRAMDVPVSLAHHDRYVAWSYRLDANISAYRKSAAN